jgi:lactoylglutathione lyase
MPEGGIVMVLNHLNLTVPDVGRTRDFFETYFGLRRMVGGKENKNFAVLLDDNELVLTLIGAGKATEVKYPVTFHIGFKQGSRERVDEIYHRLKTGGFEADPPKEFHGAWTFYFLAPGGFLVEVLYQY